MGTSLWTENYGDGTVSVVDVATGSVRSVAVGGQPGGIAYGNGSISVSDLERGMLTRMDESGHIVARIPLGGRGAGLAVANGIVYVADYSGGLTRVDATTNQVIGRTGLAGQPGAVAVGFGRVWVTNQNGTISTLNPATGAVDGPPIATGEDVDDARSGAPRSGRLLCTERRWRESTRDRGAWPRGSRQPASLLECSLPATPSGSRTTTSAPWRASTRR